MWQIKVLIFAFFVSFTVADKCGKVKVDVSSGVIGNYSAHGQFPWLASLFYKNEYYCSSSVITEKHLLSAAHCAQSKSQTVNPTDGYHAFIGRYDLRNDNEENSVRREFSNIFIHPEWKTEKDEYDADIAIFEMKTEIQFGEYIQPVCLPCQQVNILDVDGTVSGYGKSIITEKLVNLPKFNAIKAVNEKTCLYADPELALIGSPRMFCGGVKGNNPCRGDSGGPYMVKQGDSVIVYGLVSVATKEKCAENDFVLFTEVPHYLDWIKEKTGQLEASCAEVEDKAKIEDWSKKIRNGDYEAILKLAKDPDQFILFSTIVKTAYAKDLKNVENALQFIRYLPYIWQASICYLTLYESMKANNHLETYQFNILVYGIKEMMEKPEYKTLDHVFKVQFEVIVKDLPSNSGSLALNSGKNCLIKSTHFNEYFYVAASSFSYDSKRYRVFTWIPKTCDSSCHWSIETNDYGKTFKIKDQTKRQYIYANAASGLQYDSSRRTVFAWSDENDCNNNQCKWRIVLKNGKYLIYSVGYSSEYLYAANIKYDDSRRQVFTWIRGGTPTGEGEWEITCGH